MRGIFVKSSELVNIQCLVVIVLILAVGVGITFISMHLGMKTGMTIELVLLLIKALFLM